MRTSTIVLCDGQASPVGGWFVDLHGHQVFIARGETAPRCAEMASLPALWHSIELPLPQAS